MAITRKALKSSIVGFDYFFLQLVNFGEVEGFDSHTKTFCVYYVKTKNPQVIFCLLALLKVDKLLCCINLKDYSSTFNKTIGY